jgi:two-component system, OmpR family, response regulator
VTGGLWVDMSAQRAGWGDRVLPLSPQEVAVLAALLDAEGRVLSRRELARRAGLSQASSRRADSMLVGIRRALGEGSVRNVRGRGWMLERS